MTIGKFYRVTGESTQHRGVEPDVPLASAIDTKEVGESALESALPWDRIAGVPFKASADGRPPRRSPLLASEEDTRAQHDPDYRWLVSDIAAIDTVREQKSVSLNLKARREERARELTRSAWSARTAAAPPRTCRRSRASRSSTRPRMTSPTWCSTRRRRSWRTS